MAKGEKKLILRLLVIAVVVIGGMLLWSNSKKEVKQGKTDQEKGGQVAKVDIPKEDTLAENTKKEDTTEEEFAQVSDDGTKINVSNQFSKTKTLDGLEFTNISFREAGGITTLLADVTNTTSTKTKTKRVKVDVLDKEGKTIVSLNGVVDPVKAGGTAQLSISASSDIVNAYDFKISNA